MADLRRRTRKNGFEKLIWFSKIGFSLIGVFSFGVAAAAAVPPATAALPRFWASLRSFLAPPYLFFVFHLIVLVIWKLSNNKQQLLDLPPETDEAPPTPPVPQKPSPEIWREILPSPAAATLPPSPSIETTGGTGVVPEETPEVVEAAEDEAGNESMEQTWKAIMEKSSRRREAAPTALEEKLLETAVIRRREPSVTCRHELNRRFDEFIKKKYDQLRLQRHESNLRRSETLNAI